jgi:hypothetical protein
MEKTSYANAQSNLCTLNDAITENSRSTCFFCLPQTYLQSFLKKTQGGKHNLFLDCI